MKTTSFLVLGLLAVAGCMPDNPPAPEEVAIDRFDLGQKLFAQGKYPDAAIEFEYDLKTRPRWKAPYYLLASCHEKLHHEDDAVLVLQRLLRIDSTDDEALKELGRIYSSRKDPARALEVYRKLKELHPDDRSLDGEIARLEALNKP
jgi:tetratricopeptide (TPR) repeat protein